MRQEKHKKKYETLHIESIQQIYTMPAKLQTLLMLQYNAPSEAYFSNVVKESYPLLMCT